MACFVEGFGSKLERGKEGGFAEVEPTFVLVFRGASGVFGRFRDRFGEVGVGGFVEGEFSEFGIEVVVQVVGDGVPVNYEWWFFEAGEGVLEG